MDIDTLIVHCNISFSRRREHRREEERCVVDSMYISFELIQRNCDSDSWCSCILCVCIFNCYAHECFTLSVMQLLVCYV